MNGTTECSMYIFGHSGEAKSRSENYTPSIYPDNLIGKTFHFHITQVGAYSPSSPSKIILRVYLCNQGYERFVYCSFGGGSGYSVNPIIHSLSLNREIAIYSYEDQSKWDFDINVDFTITNDIIPDNSIISFDLTSGHNQYTLTVDSVKIS